MPLIPNAYAEGSEIDRRISRGSSCIIAAALGRLDGKVAIVTGGASGFGQGIATKFAHEGAKVVVADVAVEAGQSVAAKLGCRFVRADVSSRADWERLLAETLAAFGQLDVVINNAGAAYSNKPSHEVTEAEFDLVVRVNLKSLYLSTAVLLPYLIKNKRAGCFVQVASTGGSRPRPGLTFYNATKGAIITASKSMAAEYAPQQIRFNTVSPVVGNTGMTHLFLGKPNNAENVAPFQATVPLGRVSEAADVANACCYLASDEALFITGIDLPVDGGRCV